MQLLSEELLLTYRYERSLARLLLENFWGHAPEIVEDRVRQGHHLLSRVFADILNQKRGKIRNVVFTVTCSFFLCVSFVRFCTEEIWKQNWTMRLSCGIYTMYVSLVEFSAEQCPFYWFLSHEKLWHLSSKNDCCEGLYVHKYWPDKQYTLLQSESIS